MKKINTDTLIVIILWIITIIFTIWCCRYYSIKNNYSSPVKELETIDSIKTQNKVFIEKIDSIHTAKNKEINEAQGFDNDSTFKLFYKLLFE